MAVQYPYGYASGKPYSSLLTIEQIFAKSSVAALHPEYQKRLKALMIASGGKLGIGGAGRTTEQQLSVFLQRHHKVSSGGCCSYQGNRYALNSGMAHAAPPGKSFHEPVVHGRCAAVDAIGDLKWAAQNCEAYGLEQAVWGGEVWHFQFTEFPHSVSQWQAAGSKAPFDWKIPGSAPTPPTTPPPTTTPPTTSTTYTVESGESWHSIASELGCTPEALVAANPPSTMSTIIHPGQKLNVPSSATKPPTTSTTYTVKSGDSWWGISEKFGCSLDALLAANPPATASTIIHPGDVLKIPGGTATAPPSRPSADQWISIGAALKTPPGNPMIYRGSVHINVQQLQAVLCSMGKPSSDGGGQCYNPEWVDGDKIGNGKATNDLFGDATHNSVSYWQKKNALTVDGKYGPKTAEKMKAIRGK